MKIMTRLVVAAFAVLTTSAALADDQQLQNRLSMQRDQIQPRQTTVAVYAEQRAVGQREAARNEASETRFEWRHNGSGGYGAYVQGH